MSDSTKELRRAEPVEGCDPMIGTALWALNDARRRTRDVLMGLNPAAVDWQAADGGHTIGTLLYHIAAIEMDWLHNEVMEGKLPPGAWEMFTHDVRDEAGNLTLVQGESWERHWERLDKVRVLVLDIFKNMSLEDYRRVRVCELYDVTPEWVLYHLMQHEAEHRDELRSLRQRAERTLGNR